MVVQRAESLPADAVIVFACSLCLKVHLQALSVFDGNPEPLSFARFESCGVRSCLDAGCGRNVGVGRKFASDVAKRKVSNLWFAGGLRQFGVVNLRNSPGGNTDGQILVSGEFACALEHEVVLTGWAVGTLLDFFRK